MLEVLGLARAPVLASLDHSQATGQVAGVWHFGLCELRKRDAGRNEETAVSGDADEGVEGRP